MQQRELPLNPGHQKDAEDLLGIKKGERLTPEQFSQLVETKGKVEWALFILSQEVSQIALVFHYIDVYVDDLNEKIANLTDENIESAVENLEGFQVSITRGADDIGTLARALELIDELSRAAGAQPLTPNAQEYRQNLTRDLDIVKEGLKRKDEFVELTERASKEIKKFLDLR